MQLSVIIVSYNVKYFLEQCLYSVEAACTNIDAEILVVDNASQDNTIEYLQSKFPSIKFIKNNLNEGFAKANNKALQLAKGKYILFLNPDTIVAEDTFSNCINFLDAHA
jgi:GT2 family glycosyltransferase